MKIQNTFLAMVAVVSFVSTSASVQAEDLNARDSHQVVAEIQASSMGFQSATLFENGELEVNLGGEHSEKVQKSLSPLTLSKLKVLANRVSDAELTEIHNQYICMTFVAVPGSSLFVSSFDRNTYKFQGKPSLILTPNGCHMREIKYPADAEIRRAAQELKTVLEVLAFEIISES